MDGLDLINSKLGKKEFAKEPPKPTSAVTKAQTFGGLGEPAEIPLKDIVNYRKTNLKFRLTVFTYVAFSVGRGFYNSADLSTPTGRKCLESVNDFCEDWDMDTLNQKIGKDVWSSGNAFLNIVGSKRKPLEAIYMLPLSSFVKIKRDLAGDVISYLQTWGQRILFENNPGNILHFKWLPEDEEAFGEGLGQPLARKGLGYETQAGNIIERPDWFSTAEMIDDVSAKMLYSGLPRYFGFFEGEGATNEFVDDAKSKYNKLDPLQHFITNVKGDIKTVSLDTQNKFDSFIRHIDDQIVTGSMSPLIRLWSSLNFTYASSKEAVDAMMPLVSMYQRAHKRFIEKMIYAPLIIQDGKDPKKADVRLNWGKQEPLKIEEIKQVFDILSDPHFSDKFNPDDFIDLLIDAGVKITKQSEETVTKDINSLRNIIGLADKGKTVKVEFTKPQKTDPNYLLKNKLLKLLAKKYGV